VCRFAQLSDPTLAAGQSRTSPPPHLFHSLIPPRCCFPPGAHILNRVEFERRKQNIVPFANRWTDRLLVASLSPPLAPRKVVHDAVAKGKGQDRQGRVTTRAGPSHAHVQLSRVQGCVDDGDRRCGVSCGLCTHTSPSIVWLTTCSSPPGRHQSRLSPLRLSLLHRRMRVRRQ